jgi:hypothetical protein
LRYGYIPRRRCDCPFKLWRERSLDLVLKRDDSAFINGTPLGAGDVISSEMNKRDGFRYVSTRPEALSVQPVPPCCHHRVE